MNREMHLLLDIEGTITDRTGQTTGPDLIRAMAAIEDRGTPVVFCSGRDIAYMENLRKRWGLGPLQGAVAENGCIVAPYPGGVEGAVPDPDAENMNREEILKRLEIFHGMCEIDPFKRYILSIYAPGFMNGSDYSREQIVEIFSFISDAMEGLDCQIVATSASVEIMPPGVDKGTGVKRYCDLSGIDVSDVIFICDSNNDLPAARVVRDGGGKVGVVANGEGSLKRIADAVSEKDYWDGALELFKDLNVI